MLAVHPLAGPWRPHLSLLGHATGRREQVCVDVGGCRGAQEGTVAAREDGLPAAAQRIAKKAAAAWIGRSRARAHERSSPPLLRCAALRPPHPSRHLRPPLSHVAMPAAGVVAASLRRATTSLPPSLPGSHTEDCCICMWAMALDERGVPVVRLVPATPRRIKGCPALRPTNSARVCPMDPCFLPFLSSPSPPGPAPTTVRA